MTATSLFQSDPEVVRAGYPEGVPGPDRVPLLSLLRNTPLTDDQIKEVVREITEVRGDGASRSTRSTTTRSRSSSRVYAHHDGDEENIRRVAAKLAAAGWPLAGTGGPAD